MNSLPMAQLLAFLHHHPALFGIFGLVLLLFIANEVYGRVTAGPQINAANAVRMINDRDALVVDVRNAAEFKKNHVLGALNIPAASIKARANELAKHKDRPIIVYCNMGGASLEAARTLRGLGYTEIHPLRGGINSWMSANLPVTVK